MKLASDTLADLTAPGRTLAFCDDTDISGAPVKWLAPHMRIPCALTTSSEAYAAVEGAMVARLPARRKR